MKVKYIRKPKANDFHNEKYTQNKEYDVLSDYRNRVSGQVVADNGLVITNDKNEIEMIFLDDFIISCAEIENTFVFSYKEVKK